MFYQLPPAGNPVRLKAGHGCAGATGSLAQLAPDYQTRFYDSGTAALAAAVIACVRLHHSTTPEVIIPAYACPDLVSAVIHAGAVPVLVDLQPQRPWMDLQHLSQCLSEHTVAVVAVNLFGISEHIEAIRQVVAGRNITVIEDSAQGFPMPGEAAFWQGDIVIVSFGRGKPVSLMGGGAVLCRSAALNAGLPAAPVSPGGWLQTLQYALKVRAYNTLLQPRLYWMLLALPFLHLGETRYHPLTQIDGIDADRQKLLAVNIQAYQCDNMRAQKALASMLAVQLPAAVVNLPAVCNVEPQRRLLRYPLLLPVSCRDRILADMRSQGLGVSTLYPRILPETDGLQTLLPAQPDDFPNARAFAEQLLTLPVHPQVTQNDILRMQTILAQL